CCCYPLHLFFLVMSPPPPRSTLFPYTTLFRSCALESRISRRRNGGGANVRGKSARGAKGIGRKKDAGPGGCLPLPGKASARTDGLLAGGIEEQRRAFQDSRVLAQVAAASQWTALGGK